MPAEPNATLCEKCGKSYAVGEWPWCPHGFGKAGFDALTPYDDDQLDRNGPVHIGNRGERIRYMEKHGIEFRDVKSRHERKLYFDQKR